MRLFAGFTGNRIEDQFHGEADPRPRHATVGKDWRLVRTGRPGPAAERFEIVWPRQDAADLRGFETG